MSRVPAPAPLNIGLVGLGKIVVDQHLPALRANPGFRVVAGCAPDPGPAGLKRYGDLAEMLAAHPEIEVVSICTPPQVRHSLAAQAIAAGLHVLLEKPPAASVGAAEALGALAEARGVTLFAAWHSRFAPAVDAARDWITGRALTSVHIVWKEDVRRWHPGQGWIFEPGGLGVFDPGINALSILTHILSPSIVVTSADLHIPSNGHAPIAAELAMVSASGLAIRAEYDFLQTGDQTWTITVQAADGAELVLSMGGSRLEIDGSAIAAADEAEYPHIYRRLERLIRDGDSDVDLSPLRIVADAMLVGRRFSAPPYIE